MPDKKSAEIIMLPEGRLINHSLFERDQYNEKSKPCYNVELAFEDGVLDDFYEKLLDAATDKWGAGADDDEDLIIPIIEGDILARKREKKGKPGEAYNGMDVIRAKTIFNKHGEEGPGGIHVYAPDGESEIGIANREEVYQGCYVIAAVTINTYTDEKTGNNALSIYLTAVQKTRDGDRLISAADHSQLFKSVGKASKAEGGRRKRKG